MVLHDGAPSMVLHDGAPSATSIDGAPSSQTKHSILTTTFKITVYGDPYLSVLHIFNHGCPTNSLPIFMKLTRVITKMVAGSNSLVWQNLLILSPPKRI